MLNSKTRFIARSALAAAAVATCGFAQAQSSVNIYGIVSQDVVYAKNAATGGRYRMDNGRLNASRLGFKGSEDLGGGLAAIFDIETGIAPATGGSGGGGSFWNRGSLVGLKGAFGASTLGRQWNVNDDILGNFFIFGGYAVFNYSYFGATSDIYNSSIKYVSPSTGGFTLEALGALGEGTQPRIMEVGGSYGGGPLKAALTYHQAESKPLNLKDKLTSAGISYAFDAFNLRGAYAAANNALSIPGAPKARALDLGVDYTISPAAALSADYVAQDVKNSGNDTHFFRLLGKYNLSKRTQLNANAVLLKNKGSATESFYGITGPGLKQTVLGVGISHFF